LKYLVESIEKGTAKTGNAFLKVSCVSETREKKLYYLWDGVQNFIDCYEAGQKVFDFQVSEDPNFPKISTYQGVAGGNPLDFYDFIYPNMDYAFQVFDSLVSSISDTFYRQLISEVFSLPGTNGCGNLRSTFCVIPGAKGFHHNYRYGLLRHTHEVMSFVSRVCSSDLFGGTLDKELCLTGALLHDIGKCFEYQFDGLNTADYGVSAEINQLYLSSHLYKGAELVALAYERLKHKLAEAGVNLAVTDLKVEHLKHIILSHHLQREWGAVPKDPQTLEAYLVFLGDYFSAAFGKFQAIDWTNVSVENMLGSTSKYDTFFGFTPLLKKMESVDTGEDPLV
jgi:putative nucleotidyltransferase with HDIG domain